MDDKGKAEAGFGIARPAFAHTNSHIYNSLGTVRFVTVFRGLSDVLAFWHSVPAPHALAQLGLDGLDRLDGLVD